LNWIWIVIVLAALGAAFGVGRGFLVGGKGPVSVSRLFRGGRHRRSDKERGTFVRIHKDLFPPG